LPDDVAGQSDIDRKQASQQVSHRGSPQFEKSLESLTACRPAGGPLSFLLMSRYPPLP
jgi:hypothetical protein